MMRTKIWFSVVLFCCLWRSSIAATRSVRIAQALIDASPITLLEDELYQRIEFQAESVARSGSTKEPTDYGDVEIEYVLSTGTPGTANVEPGFDFTPDIGPLPATFTVTIKEGESDSNLFVLQILDDCIEELMNEPITIAPVGTVVYSSMGTTYSVDQTPLMYEIDDNSGDTGGSIEINVDQDFPPEVGFVFYEGDPNPPVIPVKGLESCTGKEVPIDDICTASIARTSGDALSQNGDYTITSQVEIDSDQDFSFTIVDDGEAENPHSISTLAFADATCQGTAPTLTTHSLDTENQFLITIIDDDAPQSYGIVYPAAIGRKESRDVEVCAITTQINTPTDLSRNAMVCPYTTELPLCESTDLECGEDTFGQCTTFPKPKRQSRERFGSYILSAQYVIVRRFPVFVQPLSDVLTPLSGPTITIDNNENVHIGVQFSSFVRELRWYFNGKELKMFRGKCNFEIHNAQYGVHDGYYEVGRVQRGQSGYRTIIRLIIRRSCVPAAGANDPPFCYNGGVIIDEPTGEPTCECPLGFYGVSCEAVDPHNFRVGPLSKGLSCRDINSDIPRDCKGALFCYPDPLGCLCARGYWGPKCDRVCPHGRYGWSCLQRCHCSGPWEGCDPKTGICKAGCKEGFEGQNCQQITA